MSMAWVAVGIAAIGTSVSAYGQYEQGQTAKKAGAANANAQRISAISAENAGAQQAADKKMEARKVAAAGVAAAGAGGIDPNTGTPLTLTAQTEQFGELDSLRIINNAQRSAWGYQTQAGIDEFQGSKGATAGMIGAGSSVLSGASSAYFGYKGATK